jgi:4-hydroxybenzoate polyprenyltransferase
VSAVVTATAGVKARPSRARVYLRLGRVSNLPTVWTNALAGMLLAGARPGLRDVLVLGIAFSLFYVAGMFLNDAFDRRIDARERPERPIPSGEVSAGEVFGAGFALLAGGVAIVALHGHGPALVAAGALAGAIVLYDVWHKGNPASPLLMAICRVLVYVTAALAVTDRLGPAVLLGAAVLLVYLMVLTYVAKRGAPGRVVAPLIAGISVVDALLVAARGAYLAAACMVAVGFVATLALQRFVRGT